MGILNTLHDGAFSNDDPLTDVYLKMRQGKTEEKPEESDFFPRVKGHSGNPLELVQFDWIGYGKEYKGVIYVATCCYWCHLQYKFSIEYADICV